MRSVWRGAADDLEQAERVVFFGYSLPSADIEGEKLFQRSIARNEALEWVDLVNPDPTAAERYARVFPRLPLRQYATLDDFLRSRK